jgi:hypothetical protein
MPMPHFVEGREYKTSSANMQIWKGKICALAANTSLFVELQEGHARRVWRMKKKSLKGTLKFGQTLKIIEKELPGLDTH